MFLLRLPLRKVFVKGLDGGFGYIFYVSGLVFHASKAKLGTLSAERFFVRLKKHFFLRMSWERRLHVVGKFYADGGTAVGNCPVFTLFGAERDAGTGMPSCEAERLDAYVFRIALRRAWTFIRHYESRNAGQAGILYFSRCARIAYLRRRRGKGMNRRATRRRDCHIDTRNTDRHHSGLSMSSVGVLMALGGLV